MLAHSKWEANAIAQSKSGASAESGSAREPEDDGFTSGGRDSAIGSQGDLSEAGISSSLFNKMRRGRHVRRRQSGSLDEDGTDSRSLSDSDELYEEVDEELYGRNRGHR